MPAVRILLLGDTGSGKSSLFVRFRKNEFSLDIAKTHGVNYHIAELRLNNTNGATQGEGTGPSYADVSSSPSYSPKAGGKTRVQLWDFAGKYRYKSMSKLLIDGVHGVMLVFDISNRASFESLGAKLEDIFENVPNEIVIHLCANKVDLPSDQWAVSRQEWMEFASNHRLLNVYETSAATGANVEACFTNLAYRLVDNNQQNGNNGKVNPSSKIHEVKMKLDEIIRRESLHDFYANGDIGTNSGGDDKDRDNESVNRSSLNNGKDGNGNTILSNPVDASTHIHSNTSSLSPDKRVSNKESKKAVATKNSPRIRQDRRGRVLPSSANVPSSSIKTAEEKLNSSSQGKSQEHLLKAAESFSSSTQPLENKGTSIVETNGNESIYSHGDNSESSPLMGRQKRHHYHQNDVAALGTYEISGKLYELWSTRIWAILLSLLAIVLTLAVTDRRSLSGLTINRYKESIMKFVHYRKKGAIQLGQKMVEEYSFNFSDIFGSDGDSGSNSSSSSSSSNMRGSRGTVLEPTIVVPYAPTNQDILSPIVDGKNNDLTYHEEDCSYVAKACSKSSLLVSLWVPLEGGVWPSGLSWHILDPSNDTKALYALNESEAKSIMTNDYTPKDSQRLTQNGHQKNTCDTFRTSLCLRAGIGYTLRVDSTFSNAHQVTVCNQIVEAQKAIEFSPKKKAVGGCKVHGQEKQEDVNIITTSNATEAEMRLFASKHIEVTHDSSNKGFRRIACIGDDLTLGKGAQTPAENSYPRALSKLLDNKKYIVQEFGKENSTVQRVVQDPVTKTETNVNSYWKSSEFESSRWFEPNIVCIMLGLHDSKEFNWNDVLFENDLTKLVTTYQSLRSKPRVYVMIMPNIEPTDYVHEHRINPNVIRYHIPAITKTVSLQTNASVIDLSMLFQGKDSQKVYKKNEVGYWSGDGVHPLDDGYEKIAKIVADRIVYDDERRKEGVVI